MGRVVSNVSRVPDVATNAAAPVTRITVIHDDGDSAVYDIREVRIGTPAVVTVEYGQLVIRPGADDE